MSDPTADLNYVHHARADGGVTQLLGARGEVVSRTEEGLEDDPSLVWWCDIDLWWTAERTVDLTPVGMMLTRAADVRSTLLAAAKSVEAGIDPTGFPLRREAVADGCRVRVTVGSSRRFGEGGLAEALRGVAGTFEDRVAAFRDEAVAA